MWIGFLIVVAIAYWFTRGNQQLTPQQAGVTALAQGQQGTITGSPDAGFTQQLSDYNTNQLTGFSTVEQQVAGLQQSQDQILSAMGQTVASGGAPLNSGPNFASAGMGTPMNNGTMVYGPVLGGTAQPMFNSTGEMVMPTQLGVSNAGAMQFNQHSSSLINNSPGVTNLSNSPEASTLTPSQFQLPSWQQGTPTPWAAP